MKLVINIPDYNLNDIQNGSIACGQILKAVKNGTPLPKGHGRLIDADDVDNHIIGSVDLRGCPTIVEADKESDNEQAYVYRNRLHT